MGLGAGLLASGIILAAFTAAIGYSIEQGMALQDALVQVQNSVQGASGMMQEMQQVMISLGNASIFSTQQIADGFTAQVGYFFDVFSADLS